MRLLYVGDLSEGGTCHQRLNTLARLGAESVPFDVMLYHRACTRIERSIASRANAGRGVVRLNRALQRFARQSSFDVAWVDKGVWIYPETLQELKRAARLGFAVHYTPDAQLVSNRSRHFDRSIAAYDLLVTTKPFEVAGYRAAGATATLLVLQGYGPQFAPDSALAASAVTLQSDVCFVGHCQPHYAARLKAACKTGARLKVWGPRWSRYARFHPWARTVVQGDGLWGEPYPQALRSTKIALGLLSKWIPETTTTRTFEIPATGTFMLAERNEDHLALFEEGREAEFFSGDEELRDKIRFYLANDAARERIAAAGRRRCETSGYSDEHQLRRVLAQVEQQLGVARATAAG